MFTKRGQVTVFVILGILLVFVAGILLFVFSSQKPSQEINPLQTDAVILMVEKCLEQTAEEAILATGKRGGYFILPEQRTVDLQEDVPYYKVSKDNFFPAPETRAGEIGKYIDTLLDLCLDFSTFETQGYNITLEAPQTKVILREEAQFLDIRTRLPLAFSKGLQTKRMEFFQVKIPVAQMQKDFAVAQEIAGTQENEAICITCFSNLAEENSLFVAVLPYYENVYVYEMTDEDYVLQDEKYVLRFAVKYSPEELPEEKKI